jgi:hypothetical protein
MRKEINVYRILVVKPEGKRPLEKPGCRQENNIKLYVRVVVWGSVDWIGLVEHGIEPSGSVRCLMTFWKG